MGDPKKSIADLKIGEKGIVCCFKDEEMSLKLLEMGCLPGSMVELSNKAPLGDPICIKVSGYNLSLRLEEAATVMLR
ncbi:iron transporter [Sporocytophaga myxococcoides]|uniref:Iron transporter n=1 Tax=Sporocytophaga myxococcoides TaxID=153721 RepID=A0A098LE77_9BACT|nr:FeoA family protein [Sporocytophaga myxococcoides]GAL84563.1 iron transporter [Sporocytophaga myxococcoides]